MLKLREEQFSLFEREAEERFYLEMVEHFMNFAPSHSQRIGKDAIEATVKYGLERCKIYGFSRRGPSKLYIELMAYFGTFFDEDPQYEWLSELVCDRDELDQMTRARLIYQKVQEYTKNVYGNENTLLQKALHALVEMNRQFVDASGPNSEKILLKAVKDCHKERYEFVGEKQFKLLIGYADECTQAFGFQSERTKSFVFALMIGFGFRFYDDPQFPWLSEKKMKSQGNGVDHEKRLEARMNTYLEAVVKNSGGQPVANT